MADLQEERLKALEQQVKDLRSMFQMEKVIRDLQASRGESTEDKVETLDKLTRKHNSAIGGLESDIHKFDQGMAALLDFQKESQEKFDARMNKFAQAHSAAMAEVDDKLTKLAAAQLVTEEKLQGLIEALRRGGNGSH
jgi:hypothetical protein